MPFYHSVSDETPLHLKHLYEPRSIQLFKADLDYILKFYEPIELKELIRIKKEGEPIKKNYFHLSFDDGLSDFYNHAAPILKEKGIPATVFLNSDFIDNKALFYRFKASILIEKVYASGLINISYSDQKTLDELAEENEIDFNEYLKTEQPYLTSQQIEQLMNQGFTIGAHSKNHPLYNELTLKEQLIQTRESIDKISSQFNLDYKVFSFPFTDNGISKEFFNKIVDEVDLTFGCAGLKNEKIKNHLQRVPMEMDHEGKDIIKSEYVYFLLRKIVGKHKITRP